jgi:hypothetical protein
MDELRVLSKGITMSDLRGVAQPGSAPAWGVGGRWFKSSRPDQIIPRVYEMLVSFSLQHLATLK